MIYGFGRCPSDQLSFVLYKYDINEELFWDYAKYLVIYIISLRVLAFIALYFKVNTFFNRIEYKNILIKCLEKFKISEQESDSSEMIQNSVIINPLDMRNDNECEPVIDNKISIAWIDLTLKNPKQLLRKEKIILRQLNGCIDFGSLNALMGPSGAGKTSLLKCLNGRNKTQISDKTKIYLSKFRRIRTCFISQDVGEHLLKGLTAKQAMIYASKLKNSDKNVEHHKSIENLMFELSINDIADTNIQNLSNGEKKRLVIAMELTSYIKPSLLCIDEPTSGLDSNAAEVVMILNIQSQEFYFNFSIPEIFYSELRIFFFFFF